MSILYEQVLKRMKEYRKSCSMTQREVAQLLGISQAQYSKMESGSAEIPYEIMYCLYEEGWDIDYLVTGEVFGRADKWIWGIFCQYSSVERTEAYQLIVWAGGIFLKGGSMNQAKEMKLLKVLLYFGDRTSVIWLVRKSLDVSQMIMAEAVGIGLRKYRQLEKESRQPDFKVLCRIYELGRAIPTLFFDWEVGRHLLVEQLWQQFSDEGRRKLWLLLESGRRLT